MTLLQQIYNLLRTNSEKLSDDSIFGGKIGSAIISAFVSTDNISEDSLTALNGLLDFRKGDISIEVWKLWIVATLLENQIINLPNGYNFEQLVREAISQSRIYCYYSPVKLTRDLMLYPFGLVSLKALKLIDGIPFYSLVEWIVLFMRDCEYFLTRSVPHIHDHTTIKASVLHSTLRFMQLAEFQKVYPWKAHQLQELIKEMRYDRNGSRPVDNYILDYMIGKRTAKHVWSEKETGYIGTIAFIYDMPELFADVFRPIDVSDTQVDNLVGIGLGLLSNSINGTKL